MENPRISIVTPSYRQGEFIEKTMNSILSQNYSNLEYNVIDGGSDDDTVETITRFANLLNYWCAEPDKGQYDAINKGFANSSGEIMAWLNSDDLYFPWTFKIVGEIFTQFPEVNWLTSKFLCSFGEDGIPSNLWYDRDGIEVQSFLRGSHCEGARFNRGLVIQQESTFWRRSLWESAGGYVDADMNLAGDFELWCRFISRAELYAVTVPLGGIREHPGQKTKTHLQKYTVEARAALREHGGREMNFVQGSLRTLGCSLHRRLSVPLHLLQPVKVIRKTALGQWNIEIY